MIPERKSKEINLKLDLTLIGRTNNVLKNYIYISNNHIIRVRQY